MSQHPFDVDTAVEPLPYAIYAARLSDRFGNLGGKPNGGYQVAIAVRALRRALEAPDPLVVSAFFLRPAEVGDVQVRTAQIRRGRRVSTGEARIVQGDRELVRVVASFTDLDRAKGRTLELGRPPELPPPDACAPIAAPIAGVTVADRVEFRAPAPPGWLEGRPNGKPEHTFWMRLEDGRAPDPVALVFLADAAAPAVLELGEPISSTIELTVHVRARPAPGWLACRVLTRHVRDGFHEEDFEIWDSTGQLVAQSRQIAVLGG